MRKHPPAAFHTPTPESGRVAEYDPLRICIFTTIALIAWLITPPVTVAIFGAAGVFAYGRARRRGLVKSRCILGDTRLVIAYLGVLTLAGIGATIWRFVGS